MHSQIVSNLDLRILSLRKWVKDVHYLQVSIIVSKSTSRAILEPLLQAPARLLLRPVQSPRRRLQEMEFPPQHPIRREWQATVTSSIWLVAVTNVELSQPMKVLVLQISTPGIQPSVVAVSTWTWATMSVLVLKLVHHHLAQL